MTSDSFETRGIASVLGGGDSERKSAVVYTGETIKAGYAIYVAGGYAYAAKNSDSYVSGIACERAGTALDTAFTAGQTIEYFPVGQDTWAWCLYLAQSPVANLAEGEQVMVSATDGYLMKWAYTNATEKSDTPTWRVGRVLKDQTGSKTDNKLILVNLGAS